MIYDLIAIVGIVWIISWSKIFKPFREWLTKLNVKLGYLLDCWGCTAFWISIIYLHLPFKEHLRLIFGAVIIAVIIQFILNKIR